MNLPRFLLQGLATASILVSFGSPVGRNVSLRADSLFKAKHTALVDINHAGIEELTTLPGIGKTTAQRIIEFREKNGPFRRVEELLIIRGISEKGLKRILPRLSLGHGEQRHGATPQRKGSDAKKGGKQAAQGGSKSGPPF